MTLDNTHARSSSRDVDTSAGHAEPPRPRRLWALLVGISAYQHPRWNLQFAHADANALYDHLISPRSGGYPPDQILRLTDAEATRAAIWDGLHTFLQQPAADDFVLVFFACHGGPDPARPNNLYIFPHDTNPDKIASSAISMGHVKEALSTSNLRSERVVLLVDACHGGGLGPSAARLGAGARAAVDAADVMNRFCRDMAESRPGMATLTAAEAGEAAWEGVEWGGGHGVFTHFLLEGLKGGAARAEDGVVTVGGLFDYVRAKVEDATKPDRVQHPHPTLNAEIRTWRMSIVSDLLRDERYRLGCALYTVAQRLDDRGRFQQAITEHRGAIEQARQLGQDLPVARYEIGRCHLALGDYCRAAAAFHDAASEAASERARGAEVPRDLSVTARFWAWAAALQANDRAGATDAASRFIDEAPLDDPRIPLVESASALGRLRRHALLIGIHDGPRDAHRTSGVLGDVRAMQEFLELAGYAGDDITVRNTAASTTCVALAEELSRLRATTAGADEVVVYFAGRSIRRHDPKDPNRGAIVIPGSDFDPEVPGSALDPRHVHDALESLDAKRVLVIADTCYGGGLIEHASARARYQLLSGTDQHQRGEDRDLDGVARGVFTVALLEVLRGALQPVMPAGDLARAVTARMRSAAQTATFVGESQLAAFGHLQAYAGVVAALAYVQRGFFGHCEREDLESLTEAFSPEVRRALPELSLALGRACLDARMHARAAHVFGDARALGDDPATAELGGAIAQAHLGDYPAAEQLFTGARRSRPDDVTLESCGVALEDLQRGQLRRALLVGVGRTGPWTHAVSSAPAQDLVHMQRALEQLFPAIAVEVLLDEAATRDACLARFSALAGHSAEAPCLFFFAGPGAAEIEPQLVMFSPQGDRDRISLTELATIAAPHAENMVCIIDAGWVAPVELPWDAPDPNRCCSRPASRAVEIAEWIVPDRAATSGSSTIAQPSRWRDVAPTDAAFAHRRAQRARAVAHLGIGGVTIYNASILARMAPAEAEPGEHVVEAVMPSPFAPHAPTAQGVLTNAFVRALLRAPAEYQHSYREIHRQTSWLRWLQPLFLGTDMDERFLGNVVLQNRLDDALRRASIDKPLFDAIDLLELRLKRIDGMDPGNRKERERCVTNRELGIAHLSVGDLDAAIRTLEAALDDDDRDEDHRKDPEIEAYLGRALVQQGLNLDAAISHLQVAMEVWSEPPPFVLYYYGKALRERMENRLREDSQWLKQAWRDYLENGAPLGHRREVRDYLQALAT